MNLGIWVDLEASVARRGRASQNKKYFMHPCVFPPTPPYLNKMPNITRYWSVSIQKSKDYHFGCFARWKWVFQRRNVRISQIFTNGICGCESTITAWARVFIFALRRGTWFSLKCLQFLSRFLGEFYIDFFNGNRSLKCKKTLTWMQTNTKRLGEYKSL